MSAIADALQLVIDRRNLSREQAEALMAELMSGAATQAQIGAVLVALRMKGETDDELAGFVSVMREHATRVPTHREGLVDTCGTGGDTHDTFNISTAAALVAAGAGVPIAKHGNRAVSSRCGSADVLRELGVNIEASPERVGRCIDDVGIGFLFAPGLHPAMKNVIGPRRELGLRTVFNMLGPLTNPAGARRQVVGVFAEEAVPRVAGALARLGCDRALVVHGLCGLDEVATSGESVVAWVEGDRFSIRRWSASGFGLPEGSPEDWAGGDPEQSARDLVEVLSGRQGPKRDIVVANAACALMAAGRTDDLPEAAAIAADAIDSGAAAAKLEGLRAASQEE